MEGNNARNMDFSLVSIIIPVFNREDFLQKTLENILENKYRPLELILVNDGSSDNSLNILKNFQEQNGSETFTVKVLDQVHQGAPAARNLGLQNAKGEYIQYIDSDDFIDPDKFLIQILQMDENDADFGLCDFEIVYLTENKSVYHSNSLKLKKVINGGSFCCGAPLLKKTLADKISWNIHLKRQQDVDYFLKAALLASKIVYIEKPFYTYIRHEAERISASYLKTNPRYDLRIKSLKEIFKCKYNRISIIKALMKLYLRLLKFKIKKLLYENPSY